jgi:hypothetical protein
MQRQVESWRQTQITDAQAKLILYSAFIDGKLEAPRSLLPEVHRLYFEPQYPEFSARTMWSLSNAFTSAFKKLDPIPQFKATAKLGDFWLNYRHNHLGQRETMIPCSVPVRRVYCTEYLVVPFTSAMSFNGV